VNPSVTAPVCEGLAVYPFRRLLIVNSAPEPDLDLLRYAAGLQARAQAEVLVASAAGERVIRSLAPAARAILGAGGETSIAFRVMLEPHLDLLFDTASETGADLIVARHPRGSRESGILIRQLLFEAPCAVCLIPRGSRPGIRRPLVRIELTERGAQLLELGCALARHSAAEELLAVHAYFQNGLDTSPGNISQLRERQELDLYRFLAGVDLCGVNCTPILEENPRQARTLLRLSRERSADLMVFDPAAGQAPVWQWNWRESEALARAASMPLLAVRVHHSAGFVRMLRERVFTELEPAFN
jgi:hypothetical protein